MLMLNLGCCDNILADYVNIDSRKVADNVVVMDLENGIDYPDNSVDYILAADVLEHLTDRLKIMNEIWRVLKPGAKVHIVLPTTDGRGAFQDPDHKSFWNRNTFWYFEKSNDHYRRFAKSYGVKAAFVVDFEEEQHHPDKIEKLSIILRKVEL